MSEIKYHTSINTLPLSKFIDIVVDDNIYALVISGKPENEQLLDAWYQIGLQYADAIKDHETKLFLGLEKELSILQITYRQILELIKLLEKYHVEQFAKMLNELLRSSLKFDVRFSEEYDKDLKRAYMRSKGIKISMDMKQMSYDKMVSTMKHDQKKPTREYYQGVLISLSDHVHYPIDESITVYQFCERIRRINHLNDQQKLKQHGKRK